MADRKPILCLDFDGVLHSYTSGWKGADVIPDPPVPGAIDFLKEATGSFEVHIFSSRSHQPGGIDAMKAWMAAAIHDHYGMTPFWIDLIEFPTVKPPALVTIDDRAIQFTGNWSEFDVDELLRFKPWNHRERHPGG